MIIILQRSSPRAKEIAQRVKPLSLQSEDQSQTLRAHINAGAGWHGFNAPKVKREAEAGRGQMPMGQPPCLVLSATKGFLKQHGRQGLNTGRSPLMPHTITKDENKSTHEQTAHIHLLHGLVSCWLPG